MDRKKFDKLNLKSQVEYINKRLSFGESLRKICDNIGIQRKTIRIRFKKINYEFSKEKNKYIFNTKVLQDQKEDNNKEEYKCNTMVIQNQSKNKSELKIKDIEYKDNISVLDDKSENYNNTIVLKDNLKEDLFKIIDAKEELFKIIDWFKKQQFQDNLIEVPELRIDREKFKGEIKITTIRVYSEIKDRFQEFIRKFPEYKSQDMYTQALLEFMIKYENL